MPDGHLVAVDIIGISGLALLRRKVGNDLVAVKVKVDPFTRRLSPLGTLKDASVKRPRRFEIIDGECEMKTWTPNGSNPGLSGACSSATHGHWLR